MNFVVVEGHRFYHVSQSSLLLVIGVSARGQPPHYYNTTKQYNNTNNNTTKQVNEEKTSHPHESLTLEIFGPGCQLARMCYINTTSAY